MAFVLRTIAFVALLATCTAQQARVFLQKTILQPAMVQGGNSTLHYVLINNGDAAATGIVIEDRFDATAFEPLAEASPEGVVSTFIPELAPGGKHTFTQDVVTTLTPGGYVLPRATLSYSFLNVLGDTEERRGYSSALRVRVVTPQEYLKETSNHLKEWGVVAAGYTVAAFLPLLVWLSSRAENDKKYAKKKAT